ncbi:MAG: bifunctional DNA-formamidopyrimidine glycosylase/DNA-(apurinic or apyrimidinic site) lyase [Parachlamydiales bacterium]|nr:bifunctional DNA-formamidopyrimidine glycosylase/DNA-(apurinic or apyrimidinic site) lyase [Parachlamydiales bacterium]
MPELAELHTIAHDLKNAKIINQKILDIKVHTTSIIRPVKEIDFINSLKNLNILDIFRKGKYLVIKFIDKYLIIHLKMTGHIFLKEKSYAIQKHEHIEFILKNNKLIYFDPRRFGRLYIVKNLDLFFKNIGPDALENNLPFEYFLKILKSKKLQIKALLLDQSILAGIGNIYADEILFNAKIHPETIANKISNNKIFDLYSSIEDVLKKAIINRGTTLGNSRSNFSSIYENKGQNQNHLMIFMQKICPICKKSVKKIKVAQRTSHFCQSCQKKRIK